MNDVILQALRTRITAVFPAQIRAAVAPLSEEEVWSRPNEQSNAAGVEMLYVRNSSEALEHARRMGLV
ncbi:MAG TPA: hypothetical protein VE010_24780 [Thermoanaerobaculia bacterium]|nr:hypothetical protein [Thermoanaerobaculia bacterium]